MKKISDTRQIQTHHSKNKQSKTVEKKIKREN